MNKCMIITEAGMSTRQKQNKLLIRKCGETIIEKTIYSFINNNYDVYVILGHQKELLIPLLEHRFGNDITIIENLEYISGIATSLKAGITAAGNNYKYFGFCNGDKPFIKSKTIELMSNYLLNNNPLILVPLFQEQSGHPTYFSANLYEEFQQISGDIGGLQIIQKFPNDVTYLPVNDEGVI